MAPFLDFLILRVPFLCQRPAKRKKNESLLLQKLKNYKSFSRRFFQRTISKVNVFLNTIENASLISATFINFNGKAKNEWSKSYRNGKCLFVGT